ncbi:MAG TPA: hypothetical protein VF590_18685 [Isosphaeraceae bacterium]|jgi:hypothetical protein
MRPPRRPSGPIRVVDGRGAPLALAPGGAVPPGGRILIETEQYRAAVATEGYVSGVLGGSFVDTRTGARDLGFGLDIVDFLLEPADPDAPISPGQYEFGNLVHGRLAKRYVEGPQICTQAKRLPATVARGDGFSAVRLAYRWDVAYPPRQEAGSAWEQILIFPDDERFFLAADRVTTVSESPALVLRVDMPGHIRHRAGMGFEHVYLSYNDPPILPSTKFVADFPPDAKFLYRRVAGALPHRFIRAYQVEPGSGRGEGPWLAGMTLQPDDVYQAWCHQRGYVCLIEELGGRPTRPGDTFGAAYLIGWFDDLDAMNRAYDRFRGVSGWTLDGPADHPTGFRGVAQDQLAPEDV